MALSAACKVYIAFSDGPLVASPTWTEVTAHVRSVRTSRGRSNELDDFSAGTCTVVLDNRGRRFDPDYSSGPHFGNLLPRRQIKVEAVHGATTYPIFRGLVQSWVQGWPVTGRDATCTVQATDLFGLLATWDLPQTAHEVQVRALSPVLWFPLDSEQVTETVTGATGAVGLVERVDALEHGGAGALSFGAKAYTTTVSVSSSSTTTIEILTAGSMVEGHDFFLLTHSGGYLAVEMSGGGVLARYRDGGTEMTAGGGNVLDKTSHVCVVRSGTSLKVYVDGVEVGTGSDAGLSAAVAYTSATISNQNADGMILDEAVAYSSALSATHVANLAAAALTGCVPETCSARVSRLLDVLGVPSALYSMQTASTSAGPFVGASDALSYMQSVTRGEMGRLYVNRSGVVAFEARTDDMGAAAVATFADDATANAVRYTGFELELDDRLVYNDVTVTGAGGVSFSAQNTTSISTYSRRALTIQTQLPTLAACRDVAEVTLARYATPQTRGRSWTVAPERTLIGSSTLGYATVLARELGDVVTVKRTPPVGSAVSKTVQITSIEHEIDLPAGRWGVRFTGAPVDTSSAFRWGTSTWGGADEWNSSL